MNRSRRDWEQTLYELEVKERNAEGENEHEFASGIADLSAEILRGLNAHHASKDRTIIDIDLTEFTLKQFGIW